jgi:DNA modification methylase
MASLSIPKNGKSTTQPLAIFYQDVRKLKPDPKNARLHSEKQIRQIAESIRVFGFSVPILVDRHLRVIAGHGRLAACRLLGMHQVPTISLDHLSEAQVRAFAIADNRLSEIATWDKRLLGEQLKALSEADLEFSLETTGFEMGEIDIIIEGLSSPGEPAEVEAIPPTDLGLRVSKPGDLWLLGKSRLICGDALSRRTYTPLMEGKLAKAVFTDPPYNVPIEGFATGAGKVHHAEFAMASGEMTSGEFTNFLATTLTNLKLSSAPGSIHFVCIDWRHIKELHAAAEKIFSELKNVCVWVKECGGMGSLYRSQHELIFVFKNGQERHQNNVRLGEFGRNRTNVWNYSRVNSHEKNAQEAKLHVHPTVKPVEMVSDAILDCTERGDIVLDAFVGSGTTIIAAERVGRVGYGIELDSIYVDLAVRRWEAYTGSQAIHASTKRSFRDCEEVLRGQKA